MERLWEWQRASVRIDSGMRPKPATTSRTRSWSASTTSMNHRSKSMNIMKIQVFWYITPCTMVTSYQSTQRNIPDYVNLQVGCWRTSNLATDGFLGSDMECQKWEEWRTKTKKQQEQAMANKERRWKKLTSSCHSLPECCSPTAASALGSLHTPIWNKTRFYVNKVCTGQTG